MSHDPNYEVFVRWNQAAKAELGVCVQGPLLSVPGRLHYLISDLGAGQEQTPSGLKMDACNRGTNAASEYGWWSRPVRIWLL